MRKVKFRAWDNEKEEWILDFVIRQDGLLLTFDEDMNLTISNADVHVMQDTGEKDINGVSVYEGDVVRIEDESGQSRNIYVYYYAIDLSYNLFNNRTVKEASFVGDRTIEVIGNIHEDPELFDCGTTWGEVGLK